jgi:hypothetical protein
MDLLESPSKHESFSKVSGTLQLIDEIRHEIEQEVIDNAEQNNLYFFDVHSDGTQTPVRGSRSPARAPSPAPPEQSSQNLQIPVVDATGRAKEQK